MSNDIEFNPGDHIVNRNFTFCNWNINSLAKDNFSRLNLIQADNSIHNYDIISLCETSLHDDVELPDSLLHGFKKHFFHHPTGNRRGGVGIFYRESLPLVIREDLA